MTYASFCGISQNLQVLPRNFAELVEERGEIKTLMATINTIDDLFEHLRNNPEWREELRKIALTTELIDLPRKFDEFVNKTFAEFVEETRTRMDTSDARFSEFANKTFAEFVEETRTRMDMSDARFSEFVNKTFAEFVEETRMRLDMSDARFGEFVNKTFAEFVEETRTRLDMSDARFGEFVNKTFAEFVEETRARLDMSDARFSEFVNKTFAEFVEETRMRLDMSDARFSEFVNKTFAEFVEETRARADASDARFDEFVNKTFAEFVEETRTRMDASDAKLDDFIEETRAHNASTDATIKVMQDDIGELKGSNAIDAAFRRPDLIVLSLSEEMRYEKTLAAQDLMDMIRASPGIVSQDVRMSFLEADLVMQAKDGDGVDHYIAAEVSYTVGSRDVDRAVRNADFLRRLTGKQAHAIVVGNEINGTASMIIERDGIPWYQLSRGDTRPR